jgi:hypothetical protein
MERTKHVEVTSSQEKQGIVNTSVQAMATRVVGQAAEMKKRFVAPITNEEGRPSATGIIDRVVKETEEALNELANGVTRVEELHVICELEFSSTHGSWEQINERWVMRIPQQTHGFQKIYSVAGERKMEDGMYRSMIFGCKRDEAEAVSIILDSKIDMRITIKGERNYDGND